MSRGLHAEALADVYIVMECKGYQYDKCGGDSNMQWKKSLGSSMLLTNIVNSTVLP